MKLSEAKRRHYILRSTLATWHGQREAEGALEAAWAAATATPDNGQAMASAVRMGVPLELIPLLRATDCIPATFFLHSLSMAMGARNLEPSAYGDTLECANVVVDAIALFEERRKQADAIEEGFGMDRSAAWATLRKCDDKSPELAARMEAIAKLAGRMFQAMRYDGLPKPSNDPDFVDGVQGGDAVERMLPEEAALLGVEGANAELLSRLEDKQVLQLQMRGETTHGRGPLVVLIDESGSMHEQRQVWSKACAVALARIALQEGRKVRVVRFSTAIRLLDLDPSDDDSMRELAWGHLSGGTAVEPAMWEAVQQCVQLESEGIVGADIVAITDGEDQYGEAPFLEMVKHGIQLWTVSIEVDLSKCTYSKPYLATYAKKYLHIKDGNMDTTGVDAVAALKDAALDNDSPNRSAN